MTRAAIALIVIWTLLELIGCMITSNLPFGEWGSIFQGDRMTAALLDRLTHRCTIFEMNGESYRFRESAKATKPAKEKKTQEG
jgi:DNA replication protein DnaC